MKASAPGKLILSGEHSVVYGAPALAVAIAAFSQTEIQLKTRHGVSFNFIDFNLTVASTLKKLLDLMHRLHNKHQDFLNQQCGVSEILQKPYELAQFAVISLLKHFQIILDRGIHVSVHSSIPLGCGLGSSAATTISIMKAIWHFFHLPENSKLFLKLALEAERLQHGFSSGLDLYASYYGGCIRFQEGKIERKAMPNFPFHLASTGTPTSTTGQSVEKVAPIFKHSNIIDDFTAVTNAIDCALQINDSADLKKAIQENERLLETIGVVPESIKNFIREIEKQGGAAKICGAGAISGDKAGTLLIIHDEPQALCERFGYSLMPFSMQTHGAKIIKE